MVYRITMGVRPSDQEWKRTLNRLIRGEPGGDQQDAARLRRAAPRRAGPPDHAMKVGSDRDRFGRSRSLAGSRHRPPRRVYRSRRPTAWRRTARRFRGPLGRKGRLDRRGQRRSGRAARPSSSTCCRAPPKPKLPARHRVAGKAAPPHSRQHLAAGYRSTARWRPRWTRYFEETSPPRRSRPRQARGVSTAWRIAGCHGTPPSARWRSAIRMSSGTRRARTAGPTRICRSRSARPSVGRAKKLALRPPSRPGSPARA